MPGTASCVSDTGSTCSVRGGCTFPATVHGEAEFTSPSPSTWGHMERLPGEATRRARKRRWGQRQHKGGAGSAKTPGRRVGGAAALGLSCPMPAPVWREEAPQTPPQTETSRPKGLAKSAPHERKQLCLRQQALSPSREAWGWPRAGPGCRRKGKGRGAEVMAGSNGGTDRSCDPNKGTGKYVPGCLGRAAGEALALCDGKLGLVLPSWEGAAREAHHQSGVQNHKPHDQQPSFLPPAAAAPASCEASVHERPTTGHPNCQGRKRTPCCPRKAGHAALLPDQVARLPRVPGPTQRGHLGPPPSAHVDTGEQGASPAAELGG